MNVLTKKALVDADSNTVELVIDGDQTLTVSGLSKIATKVRQLQQLQKLSITNSNLNYLQIRDLLPSVTMHMGLREIDFSGNRMSIEEILDTTPNDAKDLLIVGLKNISDNQVKRVRDKLRAMPFLDAFTFSACDLSFDQLSLILPDLGMHPSITKVNLSKNTISDFTHECSLLETIAKNPRIHTFIFDGPSSNDDFFSYDPAVSRHRQEQLLRLLNSSNSLVCFVGSEEISALSSYRDEDLRDRKFFNLTTNLLYQRNRDGRLMDGDVFKRTDDTTPELNRQKALSLLKRIVANDPKDFPSMDEIKPYLTAIFYLSEQTKKRKTFIANLLDVKETIVGIYGTTHDRHPYQKFLEPFLTLNDKKAANLPMPEGMMVVEEQVSSPMALFARASESLKRHRAKETPSTPMPEPKRSYLSTEVLDLDEILAKIPQHSDEDLKAQLEARKHSATDLFDYGEAFIEAGNNISMYSFQELKSCNAMTAPLENFIAFETAFDAAQQSFEKAANQLNAATAPSSFFSFMLRKPNLGEAQQGFRDAIEKTSEAGSILHGAMHALKNLEQTSKVRATMCQDISQAFRTVNTGLIQAILVGVEVCAEWQEQATQQSEGKDTTQLFFDNETEELSISANTLAQQLLTLKEYQATLVQRVSESTINMETTHIHGSLLRKARGKNMLDLASRLEIFTQQAEFLRDLCTLKNFDTITSEETRKDIDSAVNKALDAAETISTFIKNDEKNEPQDPSSEEATNTNNTDDETFQSPVFGLNEHFGSAINDETFTQALASQMSPSKPSSLHEDSEHGPLIDFLEHLGRESKQQATADMARLFAEGCRPPPAKTPAPKEKTTGAQETVWNTDQRRLDQLKHLAEGKASPLDEQAFRPQIPPPRKAEKLIFQDL